MILWIILQVKRVFDLNRIIKAFGTLVIFILVFSGLQNEASASPALCGIMSVEVDSEVNPEVNSEIDFMADSSIIENSESYNLLDTLSVEISPFCSGTQVWDAIRGLATLTNTTNKVNNYVTSGGTARAIEHFNRMPGQTVIQSPTTKTKTSDGKTVAMYTSTSTNQTTLSYPNGSFTDKIRYQ